MATPGACQGHSTHHSRGVESCGLACGAAEGVGPLDGVPAVLYGICRHTHS